MLQPQDYVLVSLEYNDNFVEKIPAIIIEINAELGLLSSIKYHRIKLLSKPTRITGFNDFLITNFSESYMTKITESEAMLYMLER